MQVEANCLKVLLIHVGRYGRVEDEGVLYKCTPYTRSAMQGIDKKGLHTAGTQQHESKWKITLIYGQPERDFRQKCYDSYLDIATVSGGEKVISCIYGFAPDFKHAFFDLRFLRSEYLRQSRPGCNIRSDHR